MLSTFNPSVFTELSKSYSTAVTKATTDFTAQVLSANQSLVKEFSSFTKGAEVQKFAQPMQDAMSGFVKTYTDAFSKFTKTAK